MEQGTWNNYQKIIYWEFFKFRNEAYGKSLDFYITICKLGITLPTRRVGDRALFPITRTTFLSSKLWLSTAKNIESS